MILKNILDIPNPKENNGGGGGVNPILTLSHLTMKHKFTLLFLLMVK